jgi:hypothetical protein
MLEGVPVVVREMVEIVGIAEVSVASGEDEG